MLLINAEIYTMEGPVIQKGYVLCREGKIADVGEMENCPQPEEKEEILDLEGKTLTPGMIDVHSHLGLMETGLGMEGDDINEDTDPCTPHLRAIDGVNPFDPAFADARMAGVTCAVISPGSANPLAGEICALKTDGRWVDEMAVAQPLAIKLAMGENPKMTYGAKPQSPITRMGTVALIREQLHKARRYLEDCKRAEEEEADPPEYDARCEALLPLLRGEIAAHIHAHKAYDILSGMRIAEEFHLRYVIVHGTEAHQIADILARKGTKVICGPFLNARTKPELSGMNPQLCTALRDAGVEFAISTDHPELPVEYLLMSASVAKANGLSPMEALQAVTIGAAKAVGLDHCLGSIAQGKDADLLVFSGDLLEVGAQPEMVFIDGKQVK